MNYSLEAVGIALAVFVVLLLLWRMGKKQRASQQPFTGNVQEPTLAGEASAADIANIPPGDFEAEVRMLIDYGNKREAIRVVREKLGLDLKDAKDLVEKMESGAPIPIEDAAASPAHAQGSDDELRQLAQSGRLIEAISLARQQKGLDLKAAKAYVERL